MINVIRGSEFEMMTQEFAETRKPSEPVCRLKRERERSTRVRLFSIWGLLIPGYKVR